MRDNGLEADAGRFELRRGIDLQTLLEGINTFLNERREHRFNAACESSDLTPVDRLGPLAIILCRGRWVLLLDSYEQLETHSDVHRLVQRMQTDLSGSTLFIGSREMPSWGDHLNEVPLGPMEEAAARELLEGHWLRPGRWSRGRAVYAYHGCGKCPQRSACGVSGSSKRVYVGPEDTPMGRVRARLQTEEGRAVYVRRKVIVEPVFRGSKHNQGFRRLLLRGRTGASIE